MSGHHGFEYLVGIIEGHWPAKESNMDDKTANDYYALVGTIAGQNLPLSEVEECDLAERIIAAGFRVA